MRKRPTTPLVFAAFGVCLNMIGSFLAMMIRLPIYLDSLGTIFVGVFCGPVYALPCALLSSLINASFDPFALPFIPAGLTAALLTGLLRRRPVAGWALPFQALVLSLPISVVSACLSAYIFGGITSAASSYIVQFLHGVFQWSLTASVFIVQVGTDYLDKFVCLVLVSVFIRRIPARIKEKI